ncbi:zinc-binding alcohol dehydrogenase family protein [Nocardioides sp.]|uniref:zinc-binding alcohol dehydrogenase family protein n=1 Tax=Nocardioides sp. TaxID=35761 RepID=UPI0037831AF6
MAQRWVATGPSSFELEPWQAPPPAPGEVTIDVRAAGVNPADVKHPQRASSFPVPVGYEVAGVVSAVGTDAPFSVGEEVLAFRVSGGWASAVTVPARDVFAKPATLSFPQAANLLLAGCTAAEMLHVVGAAAGETVLVHGASGAVGVSVLQQAAELGVQVVGTASPGRFDVVRRYGGSPVAHGDGLRSRLAPWAVAAALDCVGTEEAVSTSLALVADRSRIVTIAAAPRAEADGFRAIAGAMPASQAYRDAVRPALVALAAAGRLEVPVARTFPLADAPAAIDLIRSGHPGGKLALVP